MAEKKPMIVIKKINVVAGGHHGGAWKVAFADFMTAMMAFFLVMWLLGQSDSTKKAVSDYFSTPSVIEYNFQNYGAEITLEKLFLDLVNEPLKAFQSFMEPTDKTPNLLDMGSAKVVASFMAEQLGEVAKNTIVHEDGFQFDIPDAELFERGSSTPNAKFVVVMGKVRAVVSGLKDAKIELESRMFVQAVPDQNSETALRVASERLDIVRNKVLASLENNSVTVQGTTNVREKKGEVDPAKLIGMISIRVKMNPLDSDGKPRRKLETVLGPSKIDMKEYNSLVEDVNQRQQQRAKDKQEFLESVGARPKKTEEAKPEKTKEGFDPNLVNPADEAL